MKQNEKSISVIGRASQKACSIVPQTLAQSPVAPEFFIAAPNRIDNPEQAIPVYEVDPESWEDFGEAGASK